MNNLADEIVKRLRSVLGPDPVPLHAPYLDDAEVEEVVMTLRTSFISSIGSKTSEFEGDLREFAAATEAVAVVNGTCGLHLSLVLLGVRPGDEVIIPSLTFIGTANAVHAAGASPYFVDCEQASLGMDPRGLDDFLRESVTLNGNGAINRRTGRRISAIVPVHIFGHACDVETIIEVAAKYRIPIVEDAAGALGSRYNGKHLGLFGSCGVISFNGNKTITTGGGGVILTNDKKFGEMARHISTTAKISAGYHFQHDYRGFNFRLPSVNAAIGVAQLRKIDKILNLKRALYSSYNEQFNNFPIDYIGLDGSQRRVKVLNEPPHSRGNFWLQALKVPDCPPEIFAGILQKLNDAGFGSRPLWDPLHTSIPYRTCGFRGGMNTDWAVRSIINIPSGAGTNC